MTEHILFLTGKLAEKQLRQILADMAPEFSYTVLEMGIKVAALMNADMIARRLNDTHGATRIIIPGRCPGDLVALSEKLGVPVERGPEEVKDLPLYLGGKIKQYDLGGLPDPHLCRSGRSAASQCGRHPETGRILP